MANTFNPLELHLIKIIEGGQEPSITELGGVEAISSAATVLGRSPMMPELLSPLLQYWREAPADERGPLKTVFRILLEAASIDFVLIEAVDVLDANRPLPDEADDIVFSTLLGKAGSTPSTMSGLARGAALEGAFRWAMSNRRWQLRLLDFLLGVAVNDDPEFVTHAAKIMGVAYSHWRESDLLTALKQLHNVEPAKKEAAFELGMANLASALDTPHPDTAQSFFHEAKGWFEKSVSLSESRPDASLYLESLEILTSFYSGTDFQCLADVRDRVCAHAFELKAWHAQRHPPSWLGSRQTEAAVWNILASMLAGLAEHLDEASWWDPNVVIEQHVLAAYNVSRSVFRRRRDGSLDALLRPRIATTIAGREGQAYQLKVWLQRNTGHEWEGVAHELVEKINELVEGKCGESPNPIEAAAVWPPVAALISQAHLPPDARNRILEAVSNAFLLHLENLSAAEIEIIETCIKSLENHPDYCYNPQGAKLFDAALLWTLRFLYNRLEISKKDDPTVGYLFEKADGKLPHEDELQQDFFRWIATNSAGSDLEPTNIGGGRADLRLKSTGERLIIEVKRELVDSSFDALETSYAAQTTDYQNVSIRLGFLLVLDLATQNRQGTPHISSLVQPRTVQRVGEELTRHIVIVKVPGRRRIPSDLTKLAKLGK